MDGVEEASRPGGGSDRFQDHRIACLPHLNRGCRQVDALGQTNGLAVSFLGHRGCFHGGKAVAMGTKSKSELVCGRLWSVRPRDDRKAAAASRIATAMCAV